MRLQPTAVAVRSTSSCQQQQHDHTPPASGLSVVLRRLHAVVCWCFVGQRKHPIGALFNTVTPELGARANAAYNGGGTRLVCKDAHGEGRWAH
jgi:hypothetical protein